MLPNKIIEDIARRVTREEMAGSDRVENILRRKIDTLEENQKNLAEGVANIDEELASVINNPPVSFLVNGAFELDTNRDGVADDWEFGGTASSKSAGMAEAAVLGTKCQRITIGSDNTVAGGTAYVKQSVSLKANRRYTFSVFHKDDGIEQMNYYIMIRKIYVDDTYADIVLHSEPYIDWGHRLWTVFDTEEGISRAEFYIGISVSDVGVGASAWFDMAILNFGAYPLPPNAPGEISVNRIPIVDEFPLLPDIHYPIGTIILLTTDEKLYINEDNEWVLLISMDIGDLEGQIQSEQIAANAIIAGKIAAGAVGTTQLAAKAVTAEKLDAGAVTADMIMAGLVEAGSIETDQINIKSGDGNTIFAGNTMEVRDANNIVRVRLGRLS